MSKQFTLTYDDGFLDPHSMTETDVAGMCPLDDESDVLALEIGESHRDRDGDTWERIA